MNLKLEVEIRLKCRAVKQKRIPRRFKKLIWRAVRFRRKFRKHLNQCKVDLVPHHLEIFTHFIVELCRSERNPGKSEPLYQSDRIVGSHRPHPSLFENLGSQLRRI